MRVTRFVGQDVSITLTARLTDGSPADPTTVKFKVRTPAGLVTTYELGVDDNVSEITEGLTYQCIVDLATAGVWRVRGEAILNSNAVGVSETEIPVKASMVS